MYMCSGDWNIESAVCEHELPSKHLHYRLCAVYGFVCSAVLCWVPNWSRAWPCPHALTLGICTPLKSRPPSYCLHAIKLWALRVNHNIFAFWGIFINACGELRVRFQCVLMSSSRCHYRNGRCRLWTASWRCLAPDIMHHQKPWKWDGRVVSTDSWNFEGLMKPASEVQIETSISLLSSSSFSWKLCFYNKIEDKKWLDFI